MNFSRIITSTGILGSLGCGGVIFKQNCESDKLVSKVVFENRERKDKQREEAPFEEFEIEEEVQDIKPEIIFENSEKKFSRFCGYSKNNPQVKIFIVEKTEEDLMKLVKRYECDKVLRR